MRLAFKMMAVVMVVIALLLAVHSYLVVEREVDLFRADMDLHAYLVGSVLASTVADIWKSAGPERVAAIIEDANRSEHLMSVRWVWFDDAPDDASTPRVPVEKLSQVQLGNEVLIPEYRDLGTDYHISYFPVTVDSTRLSAVEVSQPLAPMRAYIRTTIIRRIALMVAFLLVGGVFVWWLGIRLVGRPVHALVRQAHEVGRGELNVHSDLEGLRDELGELAQGFNEMVRDLQLGKIRLDEETSKRMAAIEQLNHAERLATVGKLASGLAHELGTPLNVVAGRAKMIASEDMTPAEITDSASVIKNQAERMTGIIRQLLDFARRRPVEKQAEELIQPIKNAVHVLSPIVTQSEIEFDAPIGESSPRVQIDAGQVQQVLANLIVNAVHATPKGGRISVRYGVRAAQPPADNGGPEEQYAYIEVIDTGVGIARENLTRIFTPFYSTKQVGEGTGLGLSIAHGIIKEHGGWLMAESEAGEGSTFTIYLPLEARG